MAAEITRMVDQWKRKGEKIHGVSPTMELIVKDFLFSGETKLVSSNFCSFFIAMVSADNKQTMNEPLNYFRRRGNYSGKPGSTFRNGFLNARPSYW